MPPKVYKVLGLMSGTSLDGVDAAIIETDGETIFGFGDSISGPLADRQVYTSAIKAALQWQFKGPRPNILSLAQDNIHADHIRAAQMLDDFTLIGFHGQTLLHHPAKEGQRGQTLQLGDGQVLADDFGVPCVYDFRSADVAAGGQGAPLAPIYHKALCNYSQLTGRIAVVNIGGVSNVTMIDGDAPLRATDCGPGNGPLDNWMELRTGAAFDADGSAALAGVPDFERIDQWLSADFFMRPMPRSADRYDFDVVRDIKSLTTEDGAATLASFTAQAIARDLMGFDPQMIIICGGGRHNPAIMHMLAMHCDGRVVNAEAVGWDGDMLEAQAFGYMAVRTLRDLPISFPGTTGAAKPMVGGRVAKPLPETV